MFTPAWIPRLYHTARAAGRAQNVNCVLCCGFRGCSDHHTSRYSHIGSGQPPKYITIWTQWKKACAKAGVVDANIHNLRAMSGPEAERQGLDPQKLLGHTDAGMTRRYLRDRGVKVVQGPSIGHAQNKRAKS